MKKKNWATRMISGLLSAMMVLTTAVTPLTVRRVIFKNEQLYQFFPRRYTPEQMREEILKILGQWKEQGEKNKGI